MRIGNIHGSLQTYKILVLEVERDKLPRLLVVRVDLAGEAVLVRLQHASNLMNKYI